MSNNHLTENSMVSLNGHNESFSRKDTIIKKNLIKKEQKKSKPEVK